MASMNEIKIPITLAEYLHVCLGPLTEALEAEGHAWSPLARRVLDTYLDARDDYVAGVYGASVVKSVYVTTIELAERMVELVNEIREELEDFDRWAEEFRKGDQ